MASWAHRYESLWLDALLAAGLITGFAALAMVQCRQPARRRAWGRFGLVGSLLVIPLVGLVPLPRVDLRHPTRSFWLVQSPPRPLVSDRPATEVITRDLAAIPASAPLQVNEARHASTWLLALWQGLFIAYACGLVLSLSRLGLGLVGAHSLIRSASNSSARIRNLLGSLPFARGPGQRPRVMVSDRLGRPVLVSPIRPVILIPARLDQPVVEPQLRLGLLHELAHVEMGDHRFSLIAELARSVWFPLPQVWWIERQLRLDAEFLADHRAVEHFGTSYGYAESLVGLACDPSVSHPSSSPDVETWVTASSPRRQSVGLASALIQRVQMLLGCPFEVESESPRSWTLGVGLVTATLTLAACCLTLHDGHDFRGGDHEPSIGAEEQVFHLAELMIAPQLVSDQAFDLRFRLPEEFRLVCEVLVEPADLGQLEILGYRLGPADTTTLRRSPANRLDWARVEIVRANGGFEAVQVDGVAVVATHRPANPAAWLTIRPIPGRTIRLRDLHLTY